MASGNSENVEKTHNKQRNPPHLTHVKILSGKIMAMFVGKAYLFVGRVYLFVGEIGSLSGFDHGISTKRLSTIAGITKLWVLR